MRRIFGELGAVVGCRFCGCRVRVCIRGVGWLTGRIVHYACMTYVVQCCCCVAELLVGNEDRVTRKRMMIASRLLRGDFLGLKGQVRLPDSHSHNLSVLSPVFMNSFWCVSTLL
jgi:hypothetical protein